MPGGAALGRLRSHLTVAVAVGLLLPGYRRLAGSWRLGGALADGRPVDLATFPSPLGPPLILAACERDLLALGGVLAGRTPRVGGLLALIAPGRDGDAAAEAAGRLGARVVRGATARRGLAAAVELLAVMASDPAPLLLAVDGPLGPAGLAGDGAAVLARRSGRSILPVAAAASAAWRLPGTWSGLYLPRWGARVTLTGGPLLAPPVGDGWASVSGVTAELTAALAAARQRAADLLRGTIG
jgi:hypothetical protein